MVFGRKETKKIERKTREERFKEIASRRVRDILDKMRLLKNCANKANYSYTDEQTKKIFSVIDEEWKIVKLEFNKHKSKKREFNL